MSCENDARAAGTDSEPDSDFLLTAGSAGEKKVGDIGAGDQEDETGGGHEHPKRSGELLTV